MQTLKALKAQQAIALQQAQQQAYTQVLAFLKVIRAAHQDVYFKNIMCAHSEAYHYEDYGFPVSVSCETLMFMYSALARITQAQASAIIEHILETTNEEHHGVSLAVESVVVGLIETYTKLQTSN